MKTGLAKGTILHSRFKPNVHQFKYKMHWHLIDLSLVDQWSRLSVKHGYNRWAIFSIHDGDYISSEAGTVEQKIHRYLATQNIQSCDRVVLMSHPRYMGFSFNSVSFYFCYQGENMIAIVSEINNTPWGEKQLYCHDVQSQLLRNELVFKFQKQFHISPFMPMNIDYEWRFKLTEDAIKVDMKLFKQSDLMMVVILNTQISSESALPKLSIGAAQAVKMWAMIYWQAMKLWLKKTPFYSHPKSN